MFYPGAADLNDRTITVDSVLNDPTIIEHRIAELATPNLIVETVFSQDNSPVQGGAVIYSETTEKNFYTDNDVTQRMPGDEYTIVYRERPEAKLARVEDYGGKFATSDEARRRNQAIDFDNDVRVLSNTLVRKLNQRAIETIEAARDARKTNTLAIPGTGWKDVVLDGNPTTITAPADRPHSHIANLFAVAEQQELGIEYTKMLVSPAMKATLRMVYGSDLGTMLEDFGLDLISTNFVADDLAYFVDPGKAGFVKYEEPLTVTTWRDEAHRQTWTQAYAMPVMGITTPSAIGVIEFSKE